jgi:dGTPase
LTASKNQEMLKYQIVKALIDTQMKDLLTQTTDNLNKLKFKSSDAVKEFHLKNPKERVVAFSPTMKEERDHLQSLLLEKLYHHYRVERMTSKAKRIIQEIFDVYSENPLQLPYHIYSRSKKRVSSKGKKELDSETCKIIGNYIASMTDRFALDEHKKLFNPYQKV